VNTIESIHVAPSTEKKTEPGRFEAALRTAGSRLAEGVAAGVELAAPYVPAGTVLSAAVRPVAASAAGAVAAAGTSAPGAGATSGTTTAGGASEGDLLEATRALQSQAQTFNLQYLQLQESMQRESREFTAMSNVMKVRHESAKSAIGNIH
jgi:hypothetical protein